MFESLSPGNAGLECHGKRQVPVKVASCLCPLSSPLREPLNSSGADPDRF